MRSPDLIPADVRARLKGLRLHSRRVSGAQGIGQHQSRSRGAGLEFAQYRAYEPGDEPRQIDWKLYARSDKFFVRESERDSPLIVWVLIDATASMAQCDAKRPEWSRLQAAKAQAACVIELALRQGDRFGVIAVNDSGLTVVNAGNGPRHRDACLLALSRVHAQGGWPLPLGEDRLEGMVDGIRADEHCPIVLVEPDSGVEDRRRVVDGLDGQHGVEYRLRTQIDERLGEVCRLSGRARDDDVPPRQRRLYCPAPLRPPRGGFLRARCARIHRAARISLAPCARRSATSASPSASGSVAGPLCSARAMRVPSGVATRPRRRKLSFEYSA
jgi:hypothetical protein